MDFFVEDVSTRTFVCDLVYFYTSRVRCSLISHVGAIGTSTMYRIINLFYMVQPHSKSASNNVHIGLEDVENSLLYSDLLWSKAVSFTRHGSHSCVIGL